jgi:hypothetical protein
MVVALRLPPRADSDPPETVPRPFQLAWLRRDGNRTKVLTGRLVIAALTGAACLRALYGFLLLFLAFAIKEHDLPTGLLGMKLGVGAALSLFAGALGVGTFLATAVGTRLRIRRPVALQAGGLVLTGALGVLTAVRFDLLTVGLLCLSTALVTGLAKLAVDAAIQERIDEQVRASAFAHSETVLMLAWVVGGGFGLIPFHGRLGVAAAAGFTVLAAIRTVVVAGRLRRDRLRGRAATSPSAAPSATEPASPPVTAPLLTAPLRPEPPVRRVAEPPAKPATGSPPAADEPQPARTKPTSSSWRRRRRGTPTGHPAATNPPVGAGPASGGAPSGGGSASNAASSRSAIPTPSTDTDDNAAPPGFHIYRPSSPETSDGPTWPDSGGQG